MISPTPKVLTEADLAGLPRAVSLPPLPKQKTKTVIVGGYAVEVSGYTAEHLTAYAAEYCAAVVSERDALAGRVAELEAERDAAAKRAPDFAEFVDETDSTLEMVKRTFGNRDTPPKVLEAFATITMVEQLLKQCEQVRAALTTPESKP